MKINSLMLRGFRNYDTLDFVPSDGFNIICGDNAQGKTSLLESIFFCSFARSHRTTHSDEMIRDSARCATVRLTYSGAEESHSIAVRLQRGSAKKSMAYDNEPITKVGDMVAKLKVVMFAPESISVVKGGPTERRRFMDMGISQLSSRYFTVLQRYNHALKQRNAALRLPEGSSSDAAIHIWDEPLCEYGAFIINARKRYLSVISDPSQSIHSEISNGSESLSLEYISQLRYDTSEDDIKELLKKRLHDSLPDDRRRGVTSCGPHKDDMSILINGADTRTHASQGQQRSAALSLRLSEISVIESICNEKPILLLDDAFSELDESRRNALFKAAQGCQSFLTCTDGDNFRELNGDTATFRCGGGEVKAI